MFPSSSSLRRIVISAVTVVFLVLPSAASAGFPSDPSAAGELVYSKSPASQAYFKSLGHKASLDAWLVDKSCGSSYESANYGTTVRRGSAQINRKVCYNWTYHPTVSQLGGDASKMQSKLLVWSADPATYAFWCSRFPVFPSGNFMTVNYGVVAVTRYSVNGGQVALASDCAVMPK